MTVGLHGFTTLTTFTSGDVTIDHHGFSVTSQLKGLHFTMVIYMLIPVIPINCTSSPSFIDLSGDFASYTPPFLSDFP